MKNKIIKIAKNIKQGTIIKTKAQTILLNLFSVICCYYYSYRDGVKFEKGFTYKKVSNHNLYFLEKYHEILLINGWEKVSNVNGSFNKAWAWYRKPNNT